MTNTENYPLNPEHRLLLESAATLVERGDELPETENQADFLAFVLRSVANERDFEVVLYRLLQLARSLGGVEHDRLCDSDLCVSDCRVSMWKAGRA